MIMQSNIYFIVILSRVLTFGFIRATSNNCIVKTSMDD